MHPPPPSPPGTQARQAHARRWASWTDQYTQYGTKLGQPTVAAIFGASSPAAAAPTARSTSPPSFASASSVWNGSSPLTLARLNSASANAAATCSGCASQDTWSRRAHKLGRVGVTVALLGCCCWRWRCWPLPDPVALDPASPEASRSRILASVPEGSNAPAWYRVYRACAGSREAGTRQIVVVVCRAT